MRKSFSRICLAGEDLDWTGGNSLLCNIDLWTKVSIKKGERKKIYIESDLIGTKCIERNCVQSKIDYSCDEFDYIIGAINVFEKYYYKIESVKILINSVIPFKSGLSSSAALLTSFFSEAFRFFNIECEMKAICELCYETEYDEMKSQVGKMDFVSCMSNGLLLYRSQDNEIENMSNPFIGMDLLLIDCGQMSSTKEINKNKYYRYITKEKSFMQYLKYGNILVNEIYNKIFLCSDIMEIAQLINKYQYIMRVYLEVCTEKINKIVERGNHMGAICSKLTGCGGGGYVFSLFKPNTSQMYQNYLKKEGISYIYCKML